MVVFSVCNQDRRAEVIESISGYVVRFFEYERLVRVIHDHTHSIYYTEDMAENWVNRVIAN